MIFEGNETNEVLSAGFLLPEGHYGCAITPLYKATKERIDPITFFSENKDISSYFFKVQMIVLGDKKFEEIKTPISQGGLEVPMGGWDEEIFCVLVSKAGKPNSFGMSNFCNFLNYNGCIGDDYAMSSPSKLKQVMNTSFPRNSDGSECGFAVVKITHREFNKKTYLNKDFVGPCNNPDNALKLFRQFNNCPPEGNTPF